MLIKHEFNLRGGFNRTKDGNYLYDIFDGEKKVGELTFDFRGEDPAMRTKELWHYSPEILDDLITDDKRHFKKPGENFFLSILETDRES